jgi:hypothetical protein
MKRLIIIFLLLILFRPLNATTYYVISSGGSDSNNGSDSTTHAMATIAHAMATASSGDLVWVCTGTYTLSSQLTIPAGVSMRGSGTGGVASVITSSNSSFSTEGTYLIDMSSATVNTAGQTISYMKFDGNSEVVAQFIYIIKRSNVKIHHCNFVNTKYQALIWAGDGTGSVGTDPYSNPTYPTSYVTGNEFYNNKLTNCSTYDSYGHGALCVGGQDGMLIHDNIISSTSHTFNNPGYCIKMQYPGFMRGCKIYNNTLTTSGNYYLFALEGFFWWGMEIYNNTIIGAIDVNFISKGTYDYGAWIHNNTLGPTSSASAYSAMIFEFNTSDVIVEKNKIRYCYDGIMFTPRTGNVVKDYRISYNLFQNSPSGAYYTRGGTDAGTFTFRRINYYNNVFDGGAQWGLSYFGTCRQFTFINNIMTATSWYPIGFRGAAADTVNFKNNNLYNCTYSVPYFASTATNYTNSGNITTNPKYTTAGSDFTLQSSSPCKDVGLDVGLYTDYLDYTVPYNTTPDMGAYEYGSSASSIVVPTVTTASISSITYTTASGGGDATSTGGAAITAKGVCWSINNPPTIANSYSSDGTGTGSYSSSLTALSVGTTYYYAAYATNSAGTGYGSVESFSTKSAITPTVTTTAISNITTTTASSGGNVTDDGGSNITVRGVCWNTSGSPTISNSHTSDGSGTGSYSSSITGLTLGTTYYVRAYATNSSGTSYGSSISFTTQSSVGIILKLSDGKILKDAVGTILKTN